MTRTVTRPRSAWISHCAISHVNRSTTNFGTVNGSEASLEAASRILRTGSGLLAVESDQVRTQTHLDMVAAQLLLPGAGPSGQATVNKKAVSSNAMIGSRRLSASTTAHQVQLPMAGRRH